MVIAMADGNVAAGKPTLPHASCIRQSKRSFPAPEKTQERERAKTRSLSKTIGCPMIDKDPQMIR